LTDTTDLLQATGDSAGPSGQDTPAAAPRVRRRATSGGGLASLVLPELQSLAGDLGITGIGRLRKSQLIEAIQERQGNRGPASTPATSAPGSQRTERPDDGAPSAGAVGAAAANGAEAVGAGGANGGGRAGSAAQGSGAESSGAAPGSGAEGSAAQASAAESSGPTSGTAEGGGMAAAPTSSTNPAGGEDGPVRERVDRGRERFLEREARRAERAAQTGDDGDVERSAREDRGRDSEGQNRDAQYRDSQYRDGQNRDSQNRDTQYRDSQNRDGGTARDSGAQGRDAAQGRDVGQGGGQGRDANQGERSARSDRPARQGVDKAPLREDDEEGGRRGRFRERGRNRNRNNRVGGERFGGEADPVVGEDDVLIPVGGILDILDNYGFVRTSGYLTGPSDVYLSMQQVRKYGLRRGDAVTGAVRQQREGERKDKYNALVRLDSVNGLDPSEAFTRPEFTKLTPLYPQDRLRLETEPNVVTTRVIDLVMPIGKGQRALIVSPPKAGKTMVMQAIANAITTNNPECHLMVVLVDERPEEVTDMQRSVKGEVIASTFDRPPQDHITVAELSIERAKRLVELGHDVVVLLDSITRLGRAYNLGAPASGRILTGGVDSAALYPPKRFLGAARNIENGGSLTIFATALVETGSAMDTVIFEEFKGTGNAELKLDRALANKRIFPAIDVDASSTRKEEILLAPQELRIVLQLRRALHALDSASSLELLLDKMKSTRTNVEFLMQIQKTSVEQGSDQI